MFLFILILVCVSGSPIKKRGGKTEFQKLNLDSIQICPGGTLEINVIVQEEYEYENYASPTEETEKEELVCVQNNNNFELNCQGGNCVQNNIKVEQNCEDGNCSQINGGNVVFTTTTTTSTTTTTATFIATILTTASNYQPENNFQPATNYQPITNLSLIHI